MVVAIATVFIICVMPGTITLMLNAIFPTNISIAGKNAPLLVVLITFSFLAEDINASVNFFIYYNMGNKFRMTFQRIMCCFASITKDKLVNK